MPILTSNDTEFVTGAASLPLEGWKGGRACNVAFAFAVPPRHLYFFLFFFPLEGILIRWGNL